MTKAGLDLPNAVGQVNDNTGQVYITDTVSTDFNTAAKGGPASLLGVYSTVSPEAAATLASANHAVQGLWGWSS
jgi:hypothetical protein